jgi:hypothetical protein
LCANIVIIREKFVILHPENEKKNENKDSIAADATVDSPLLCAGG